MPRGVHTWVIDRPLIATTTSPARVCVCACVRACVRVYVTVHIHFRGNSLMGLDEKYFTFPSKLCIWSRSKLILIVFYFNNYLIH